MFLGLKWFINVENIMMTITILLCCVNALLASTSIFSNGVVILAIVRTPSLHNPSNILLCNLALSDLGVGLIVQPIFVSYIMNVQHRNTLLDILGVSSVYFTGSSIITMTCIALDRCLALFLHMRYHTIVTTRRAVALVLFMWIVDTLSLGIIYKGDFQLVNGIVATSSIINFSITTACYFYIYRTVRHHKRQITDQMRAFNVPRVRHGRSITTMVYIHGIFIICLIPFVLTLICYIAIQRNQDVFHSVPIFCTGTLVFMSSAINPYLYCWRMADVRKAAKKLFNDVMGFAQL